MSAGEDRRPGEPAPPQATPGAAPAYRIAGVTGTAYTPSRRRQADAAAQAPAAAAPLARPQAIPSAGEAQAPAGETVPPFDPAPLRPDPPPPPRRWPVGGGLVLGFLGMLLLVGALGGWAWGARITGAVVAQGQVEVESHSQIVQHPDGGVVEAILVREGQQVEAGQPLIRLDGGLLATELSIVEGQYFEVMSRRGRLEAERADETTLAFPAALVEAASTEPAARDLMQGQQALFEARHDTLRQSLEQLDKQAEQTRAQIEGIDAQAAAMAEQRDLIGQELADAQTLLDKGLAQAPRVLALRRDAAGLDGALGELTASRAQAESRITEIEIEQLRQTAARRENAEAELRDLGYRELELAERRRSLREQIGRLEVRAPVSGIVHQLKVTTPRSVIRAADPILFLVPQDRPLVIAAQIATINIDEVRPGQQVALRFSSFSSRTTPEIFGVLERISAAAVTDERTQIPYYRGEVSISAAERAKLGDLALIPGMPVEVYVQTGERRPIDYLMQPLTDYFARAFRES